MHTGMRSGIKIISETRGDGDEIKNGDRLLIRYDIHLSKGDVVVEDREMTYTVGDRNAVAGFRYGLEGMRIGGVRRFKAGPHLCYRDLEVEGILGNAYKLAARHLPDTGTTTQLVCQRTSGGPQIALQ